MNNIKAIEKELRDAGPGTIIRILGYVNSAGKVSDVDAKLLAPGDYANMQKADLHSLKDADSAEVLMDGEPDLATSDLLAAREQMLVALEKSVRQSAAGEAPAYRGAEYVSIGGSLASLPDKDEEALYIQRLLYLGKLEQPKPAKGAVPRAKQRIKHALNLNGNYYMHTVKLAKGKFTKLEIVHKAPLVSENPE